MIRSRTDAVEFVRRVGEYVPSGVMRIKTLMGNTLVVRCAPGALWTKRIEAPNGSIVRAEEAVRDPAGWVYANRRAVNRYLRR